MTVNLDRLADDSDPVYRSLVRSVVDRATELHNEHQERTRQENA